VIAVGFVFLGVGFWSVALALVVLAIPPILTNAYVAVDASDRTPSRLRAGWG
jgi:osmoprotectant transport system permease protein